MYDFSLYIYNIIYNNTDTIITDFEKNKIVQIL